MRLAARSYHDDNDRGIADARSLFDHGDPRMLLSAELGEVQCADARRGHSKMRRV